MYLPHLKGNQFTLIDENTEAKIKVTNIINTYKYFNTKLTFWDYMKNKKSTI